VRIELRVEDERVVAAIRDEGRGFGEEIRGGGGLGLLGMQERAAMVGGRLSIESQRGKGTLVRVEIPVERERS
jgi:two-component system sensor histidine kinase NreB